jgi:hypothetical protein
MWSPVVFLPNPSQSTRDEYCSNIVPAYVPQRAYLIPLSASILLKPGTRSSRVAKKCVCLELGIPEFSLCPILTLESGEMDRPN